MEALNKMKRLLHNLLHKDRVEAALDAELWAYVEELTDRNVLSGMTREEARRQALVEVGGIEQVKEEVRQEWLGHGIETVAQDIRFALRTLLRAPGFAALVVMTLALGIGANLTMFSLVRAVLWRPLPYPDADRIVTILVDARNRPNTGATPGEVLDLKERSRSFEQVSMIESTEANLEYQGQMEHVTAASVSDNLLPLLGVRPALGRALDSRVDWGKQQALAVLISDELWRRRSAADPGVVGKVVGINDVKMQIAGGLPQGVRLLLPPSMSESELIDVWLPSAISATRQYRGVPIVARLRPGVTLTQANAELQTLAAEFEREHPEFYSGDKGWQASPADRGLGSKIRFTAHPLQEDMTGDARPALFLLSSAVGFVLLIACVNVASLMLGRGLARQREFEIRRALGGGRARIIRQLLTEGMMLAAAAATIGLFCAHFGLNAIISLGASRIPLQSRAEIDAPATLFALVLSVATSVLFGLLPASGKAGMGAPRLQRTLVVAEVALSIVPMVCGGLMLRTFLNLLNAPLGFNPANVLTVEVPFNLKLYPDPPRQWVLLRDLLDRVHALPGVESVSAANPLPLAANQEKRRVGRGDQSEVPPILATQQGAIPGYLGLIGTPLLEGRDFTEDDIVAQRKVTIIDEGLAKRLWPEGALGKRLLVYRTGWRSDLEVIGVTAAVRVTRVRDENIPHIMMPSIEMTLLIKTRATASQIAPGIASAVNAAHGGRAPFDVIPMSEYVADSIGDTRFVLFLLAAFAGGSVLLATVGVYGTLAYLTAQRTREFGIRLALGASAKSIVSIVVRESVLLAVTGVGIGLLGAIVATRAIQGMLYGVQPLDGMTLLGVVGIVAVVALVGAGVPAWRASRIDPQTSLRSEP